MAEKRRKEHGRGGRLRWRLYAIFTLALALMAFSADDVLHADLAGTLFEEHRARLRERGIEIINVQDLLEPHYDEVLQQWLDEGYEIVTDFELVIDAWDYVDSSDHAFRVVDSLGGRNARTLLWEEEESWIEWEVTVPKRGLYQLGFEYYNIPGKRSTIQRDVKINGEWPFNEAKRLIFHRIFADGGEIRQDNQGNDLRPQQVEIHDWQYRDFYDPQGMYRRPFLFALEEGPNRIRMEAIREPMAISALRVSSPKQIPTYAEVRAEYERLGYQPAKGHVIRIQGEDAYRKAEMTVRAEYGWDPNSDPPAYGYWRLNEFGSWRWRMGGSWATWEFEVPESGLYQLAFRVWQGWSERLPYTRSIAINGEIPFEEFEEVTFHYNRDWQMVVPADENGEPYLVYLEKGRNSITLTPMIGPIRRTLLLLRRITQEMATIDRQVTMVTGSNPDPNRDFEVHKDIPDLLPRLQSIIDRLRGEADWVRSYAGSSRVADQLDLTAHVLQTMVNNPRTIPRRITEFANQQQSLSYWTLELTYAPLALDYILVLDPENRPPPGKASAYRRFKAALDNFLVSFVKDYTSVGSTYDDADLERLAEVAGGAEVGAVTDFGDTVLNRIVGPDDEPVVLELWVGRGREWAQIIKEMIEESFTPLTGVRVNVNVIPPNQIEVATHLSVLLLNVASGNAPDVAFGANNQLPVEFAIRGGVVDLSQFPDYQQVTERFRPGALIPYHYAGGDYALPETQGFNMLFYRTDILGELGLTPPETWDDVINLLPSLQQFDMNFYYESQPFGFTPFLFQYGGDFYTEDTYYSALDTPEALAAFTRWTSLFSQYRIPIEANFYNRMRTGEIPIGVQDYYNYVLLSTAAPELTGWWQMDPIPGVRREDGSIDRTTGGWADVAVIFRDTKHPEAAWELLKWWTSENIQSQYAMELEGLIGVEARWNTSNMNALRNLPWPQRDIQAVEEQFLWFREMPVVLGGYFTPRHIMNAWNRVVLQGVKPREALEIAVRDIDRELRKKQQEFGIEVPPRGPRAIVDF